MMSSSEPSRGDRLRARARLVRGIRAFLDALDFVEIEAPLAVHSPGLEPHLDAFELARPRGARRYLHTSPEYALKRILGTTDLQRIYSLGPCFRDEPASRTHSPEFTMLEWYCADLDLFGLMQQTEDLVRAAAVALHGRPVDGAGRDLSAPFERLSVREAWLRHTGVDPWPIMHDSAALRAALRAAGVHMPTQSERWEDLYFQGFLNAVEPQLSAAGPCFLWGFPADQAALARIDPADESRALRFELYGGGHELANAFDELRDASALRARFEQDLRVRAQMGSQRPPIDERLLAALPHMPPNCGIALGVDRLAMWLLGLDELALIRPQPWETP